MPNLPLTAAHIIEALVLWAARARQRRQLAELSDHLLLDVGLTRDGALAEARRPPWSGGQGRSGAWRQSAEHAFPQATPAIALSTEMGRRRRPQ